MQSSLKQQLTSLLNHFLYNKSASHQDQNLIKHNLFNHSSKPSTINLIERPQTHQLRSPSWPIQISHHITLFKQPSLLLRSIVPDPIFLNKSLVYHVYKHSTKSRSLTTHSRSSTTSQTFTSSLFHLSCHQLSSDHKFLWLQITSHFVNYQTRVFSSIRDSHQNSKCPTCSSFLLQLLIVPPVLSENSNNKLFSLARNWHTCTIQ